MRRSTFLVLRFGGMFVCNTEHTNSESYHNHVIGMFHCLFIVLKISLFSMSSSHDPVIRMFYCLFIALKTPLFSYHLVMNHNWMTWRTVGFSKQWKDNEHSDHWIMTGWHGEQWGFQSNEKTMEHSLDGTIDPFTGWHYWLIMVRRSMIMVYSNQKVIHQNINLLIQALLWVMSFPLSL